MACMRMCLKSERNQACARNVKVREVTYLLSWTSTPPFITYFFLDFIYIISSTLETL
jgi:hypothetical protein